ncbi:MAG: elongation factor P [bacterium]|nr:elongation factor P [bacterium]
MIPAGDLKKGTTLKIDGTLWRVVSTEYNKPGRGTATMQTTLLNIETGKVNKKIFSANESLDNVFVESEEVQYLYRSGDTLHFMNNGTFDQYEADIALFGDDQYYLKDGMTLELRIYEGRPIDYVFPTTMVYEVVEAEVAVVGDTAGAVTKKVLTDTGLSVKVPMFINVGEKIKVDTRDGSFISRA